MIDKKLSSLCRDLLRTHSETLTAVIEEIKKEQESPINETSTDAIALEYQKRQGVKMGLALLMQRLTKKADYHEN